MSVTVNPTTSGTSTQSSSAVGGKALTGQDFMKLMITQLQHQDPMSPTDSNQLLQQIAQISSLQSNQQLQGTLTGMGLQQSIGAGGNLIGKAVEGLNTKGDKVNGQVIGVQVQDQKVYLALNTGEVLPLENVTTIAPPMIAKNSDSTTGQQDFSEILQAISSLAG